MKNDFGRLALLGFTLALPWSIANAQGTFTNLGFESPVLPLSGSMLPSQAVPGWLAYVPSGFIGYNTISLGGTSIILHDSNSPFRPALLGNFSLQLFNGLDGETAMVGQIEQIPTGSLSVRFVATSLSPAVSFGGTPVVVQQIGSTARFNLFAGDITSFAGQTGELRFSQTGMLDGISFSALPVPEPGAVVLLSVGAILLWTRLRQRR